MYDEDSGKRVECRALNIPEELGQIQYVFCDKTGTLTENKMVFKKCTVGGQDFAHNTITIPATKLGTSTSLASLNQALPPNMPGNTPTGWSNLAYNLNHAFRVIP